VPICTEAATTSSTAGTVHLNSGRFAFAIPPFPIGGPSGTFGLRHLSGVSTGVDVPGWESASQARVIITDDKGDTDPDNDDVAVIQGSYSKLKFAYTQKIGTIVYYSNAAGSTARLTKDSVADEYTLTNAEGTVWKFFGFNTAGVAPGRLKSVRQSNGEETTFQYTQIGGEWHASRETDPAGFNLDFAYQLVAGKQVLREASDALGRKGTLQYDAAGNVVAVVGPAITVGAPGNTFPGGKAFVFQYDTSNPDPNRQKDLVKIFFPKQVAPYLNTTTRVVDVAAVYAGATARYVITYGQNAADPATYGRAMSERIGDGGAVGGTFTFQYEFTAYGAVLPAGTSQRTTMTDPNGNETLHDFDSHGNRVQLEEHFNRFKSSKNPTSRVTTFGYYRNDNLLARVTYPEGNVAGYLRYPENDPDGDGLNLIPGKSTKQYGFLKEVHSDVNPADLATLVGSGPTGGDLTSFLLQVPRRNTPGTYQDLTTRDTYDSAGNVKTVRDPRGNVMTQDTNELRQVYRSTGPAPFSYRREVYFDAHNNVSRIDTEDKVATVVSNDPANVNYMKVAVTLEADGITANFPVEAGPGGSIRPGWFTDQTTYDFLDRPIIDDRDASGSTPACLVMTSQYDRNDNRIKEVKPEGNWNEWDYDELNRVLAIRRGGNDPTVAAVTVNVYNRNNNLTHMIDAADTDGSTANNDTVTIADAFGGGSPLVHTGDLAAENIYDGYGRLKKSIDAVGGTTEHFHDPLGNVIQTEQRGTTGGPTPTDRSGSSNQLLARSKRYFDEASREYETQRDVFLPTGVFLASARTVTHTEGGLLHNSAANTHIATVDLTSGGSIYVLSRTEFDRAGRVTHRISDSLGTTITAHDGVNRVIKSTDSEGDSNITRFTDENSSFCDSIYDALNRLTNDSITRAAGVVGTTLQTFEYDGLARTTRGFDNGDPGDAAQSSVVTQTYESMGRQLEESSQIGSTGTIRYTTGTKWRAESERLELTYQNGRAVQGTSDSLGRPKTLKDASAASPIATWRWIGPGRLIEMANSNGLCLTHLNDARSRSANQAGYPSEIRGYDGVQRIIAHRWLPCTLDVNGFVTGHTSTTPAIGFRHAWNAADNKLSQELMHGTDKSETYKYDSASRLKRFDRGTLNAALTDVVTPTPIPNILQAQTWTLDGPGNWPSNTTTTNGVPTTESRTHNNLNQITIIGATSLIYDSNGNLADDGTYTFAWDAKNRLRKTTRKSDNIVVGIYAYDALDRRIRRTCIAPGTPTPPAVTVHYYMDGQRVIEEREPSGGSESLTRQYTYGPYIDEVLTLDRDLNGNGSATDPGERLFYHANTLYSIYALSDINSTQPERYIYDAYGRHILWLPGTDASYGTADDDFVPAGSSSEQNAIVFHGRAFDSETTLLHYRRRGYSPNLGRFIGRDPLQRSREPNLYLFLRALVTRLLDPQGTKVILVDGDKCGELKKKVEDAIKDACKKINEKKDNCIPDEKLRDCLQKLCGDSKGVPNVSVTCYEKNKGATDDACDTGDACAHEVSGPVKAGSICKPSTPVEGKKNLGIVICVPEYGEEGFTCDPAGGTILHELVHLCGLPQEDSEEDTEHEISEGCRKACYPKGEFEDNVDPKKCCCPKAKSE